MHPQLQFDFFIAWEGLLGGSLWALSNALVIPTVKLLGLGVGFTLYHSVNLVFGYLIGRFELFGIPPEPPKNIWQDGSQLVTVLGFLLLTAVDSHGGTDK